MKHPVIILIDDDAQVLRSIERDMKNRYRETYRIIAGESANEMLELLEQLKRKNETVALFLSDQRMPEMDGIGFLESASAIFPEAKRVLLTAYSDIEAAIRAINEIRLNHYLLKPWNPPEEKLYPVIDDLLEEWQADYHPAFDGIKVLGFQWSAGSHRVKEFLAGNLIPYQWMDLEQNPEAVQYLPGRSTESCDFPVVIMKDGAVLMNPSVQDIAGKAGLRQEASLKLYDVVIIGAGPSGLAASVYGSSEGLKTLLIEKSNPGGQASSSSRIENYLGFPSGLSGADLSRRAISQTLRFGTEILTPKEVKSIRVEEGYKILTMDDASEIVCRAIVISTGVAYRRLDIEGLEKFNGAGVYYGSAAVEAHACKNEVIYLVGGGNSACQAALYMAGVAREVHILIRQDSIRKAAANYLAEQILTAPNIFVHAKTEVIGVAGNERLETLTLRNDQNGQVHDVETRALFIYIGAKPATAALNGLVMMDDKGFIITGRELLREKSFAANWKAEREPYLSETSIPGIFASGDVRHGALTGISSAVGEGAMAIRFVRKYLQEN
jgi:thioredoxin reductase (NADPH)